MGTSHLKSLQGGINWWFFIGLLWPAPAVPLSALRVISHLDWLEMFFQNKGVLTLRLGALGLVRTQQSHLDLEQNNRAE